jgi:multidrug efflux pump subunit AcrA (membrane-fusion protein)
MSRKVITAVILLAAAAAGAAYYYDRLPGLSPRTATGPDAATTILADATPMISVVKARRAEFNETVMVSGSLVAREEILVAPEIEGLRVVELFAEKAARCERVTLARLVSG